MHANLSVNTHTTIDQSFLQSLRSGTKPWHEALEKNPLSEALMSTGVTSEQYGEYLARMSPVIAYCEKTLFPILQPFMDTTLRTKFGGLAADLNYLQVQPLPEEFSLGTTPTIAQALGYCYVIEGSTLGGRVILKHVQNYLHVTDKQGAVFFAGYGTETGKNWMEFLYSLTLYVNDEHTEEETLAAAIEAFRSIDQFFAKSHTK